MKRTIYLLLALILLTGVFSPLVMAEQTDQELNIAYCNLSFRDTVCIKYAVRADVSDVKILIWNSPKSEYSIGTQDSEITEYYTETISGVPHKIFDYTSLSAKQMGDVVYACAYAQINGVDCYSKVNKYSILQYAYNKLGKTATASTDTEMKEMLTNMLVYGASAQKYFDYKEDRLVTDDWYQIKVTAGALSDGSQQGLYLTGEQITLIAPETNANGETFSHWEDSNGNKIATTAVCDLTVGSTNAIYTPIYSNAVYSSVGLAYELNADRASYSVTGLGTCEDKDIVIPSVYNDLPVTSIASSAFYMCSSLTSITIPEGVTEIGGSAFSYCSSLKSIMLPTSLTNIVNYAFSGCSSLTSISLPDGITRIGHGMFSGCSSLTSITIPDSVTSFGDAAFSDCSSLTSIAIPDGVTSIGSSAFGSCSSLTSITLPDSVTSIGSGAFGNCSSLTSITIPNGVTSIINALFSGCSSLTSITLPDSVTKIGSSAFAYCSSLKSITLPDGVTKIDSGAFYDCSSLTSITIPDGVTSFGESAFRDCSSLTSITIPNSVEFIPAKVFSGCGLTRVYYCGTPDEWKNITIRNDNDTFKGATRYYYNETAPTDTEYNYWHYVDGVPTEW